MSVDPPAVSPPSRPRRRWLRAVLWSGMVVLLAAAVTVAASWYLGTSRLKQARAEADRLDPGWRWDDIQASRRTIPDDKNSALTVERVAALLPGGWDAPLYNRLTPATEMDIGSPTAEERFQQLAPNEVPDAQILEAFRKVLDLTEDARREAQKLADQPKGRLVLPPDFDYLNGPIPLLSEIRTVARLLGIAAQMRAAEGKYDEAIVLDRCLLHAGGAYGDEPLVICQLVRFAVDDLAVEHLQRVLGQGEASPAELERLQRAYEDRLSEPALLIALRGERAGMDRYDYMLNVPMPGGPPTAVRAVGLPGWNDSNCATVLEQLTQAIEIARKPSSEQRREFAEWSLRIRRMHHSIVRRYLSMHALLVLPAVDKIASTEHRRLATQGCVVLALAAERYRLQHGRWPEQLDDLKPFVRSIPIDPYGQGFKMKRTETGIVFYSVGPDDQDDGGKLGRKNPLQVGVDDGFALWDVDKRRQVVRPVAPAVEPMP